MIGDLLDQQFVFLPVVLSKLVHTGAIVRVTAIEFFLRNLIQPVIDIIRSCDNLHVGVIALPVLFHDQNDLISRPSLDIGRFCGLHDGPVVAHQLDGVSGVWLCDDDPPVNTLGFRRNVGDLYRGCVI